jgi:hypothetical protein
MKEDRRSVDEIIQDLPAAEKPVVKRLRALVREALPFAIEKNSYGVPFYSRNRMICFIWPPSVCWGPKKQQTEQRGVTLGFCQGNLMSNDEGLLLAEGRKQVYCMYFKHVSEINDNVIRALLFEAEMVDSTFKKKRPTTKKITRSRKANS